MNMTNVTSLSNATSLSNCSSLCPTADDNSNNEFSVQNLVGIFLTLSLCLLTQPYGSLFYNPPSSKIGQRLFFTWRLNPLACIAETAVIIVSLVLVLRLAIQDPEHNTLPSVSRKFPFYHARTERSRNWKRHWHLHAAALLLIRANEEGVDGGVLERLIAESLLRDGEPAGEVVTGVEEGGREATSHVSGIELAVMEGSRAVEVNPGENNTPVDETSPAEGSTSGADSHASEPQLGVLRRRTSQLEAALTAELETHGQDRLADLRKVLGNNVLAHKEKWVNLVTSFSVLGVAIKLAATTLPWTVRVPAAFFLAGWSSVQFLLYLFNLGELDEGSAGTVLKTMRLHRQLAKDPVIQRWMIYLVALVVVPPVIWLGFCAGFPTFYGPMDHYLNNSTNTTGQEVSTANAIYHSPVLLTWFMSYMYVFMMYLVLFALAIALFTFVVVGLCGLLVMFVVTYILPLFLDFCRIKLSQISYIKLIIVLGPLALGIGIGGTYGGIQAAKGLVHVEGVVRFSIGLIGACALIGTSSLLIRLLVLIGPCRLAKEEAKVGPGTAAAINTVVAFYLFGLLVYDYDSEGTYKPAWLEYLG